jgi:hypothetical protein
MKKILGNVWDFKSPGNYIGILTNGVVKNGCCIMGAGQAKQAKDLYLGIDKELGALITCHGNHVFLLRDNLFSFPTKSKYWESSSLELIEQSCKELKELIDKTYKQAEFYICPPGCGLGGLKWEQVEPIMLKYFEGISNLTVIDHVSN